MILLVFSIHNDATARAGRPDLMSAGSGHLQVKANISSGYFQDQNKENNLNVNEFCS